MRRRLESPPPPLPELPPGAAKACPFCGGEAGLNVIRTTERDIIELNGQDTFYGVNCIACGARTSQLMGLGAASVDLALAAWNRRITEAA